jgi:hypothetical protein
MEQDLVYNGQTYTWNWQLFGYSTLIGDSLGDISDKLFEVPNNKKPKATQEMCRKIAALLSLQGKNLIKQEDGLYRQDAFLMAMDYLSKQGYDINFEGNVFMGGMSARRINPREEAKTGHHREKRLILKLIFTILDISFKGDIKLPGYYDQKNVEGKLEYSSLYILGRELKNLGGDYYVFGEKLFANVWEKERSFLRQTIDKFEHFLRYCRSLTNEQRRLGIDAINQYREEKNYPSKYVQSGPQFYLIEMLQIALSNEIGRYISLSEMGTMYKGRNANDKPKQIDYFSRRLRVKKSNNDKKTISKFSEKALKDLKDWIKNPIEWYMIKDSIRIDYRIELSGKNLEIARTAIDQYSKFVYGEAEQYLVPSDSPNKDNSKIFEILRSAYSRHPHLNPDFGERHLTLNSLVMDILKDEKIYNEAYNGKPLSNKKILLLVERARSDLLQIYAYNEYNDLVNELQRQNRWIAYTGLAKDDFISYQVQSKEYANQIRSGLRPLPKTEKKKYFSKFFDPFVAQLQTEILLRMWGYKDAMTGDYIPIDPKTSNPQVKVNRHHFKISDPNNKIECWIEVLVPLTTTSHGAAHTKHWESFFSRAMEAMMSGEFNRLLDILSEEWKKENIKEYRDWLKKKKFI